MQFHFRLLGLQQQLWGRGIEARQDEAIAVLSPKTEIDFQPANERMMMMVVVVLVIKKTMITCSKEVFRDSSSVGRRRRQTEDPAKASVFRWAIGAGDVAGELPPSSP